ncbi:MAG TPA: GNAT family protein [Actinomycetota bacterium]|nr:GNAT family protein [Actinomycetota bacterium]
MLGPAYPLETARLVLRPFVPEDLEALFAFQSLPEVARFLYWEARDREQVREVLEAKLGQAVLEEEGQVLALAVVLREVGQVVGEVNLQWLSRRHRQGEIGFVFHPGHQGRGLATEAAEEALRLGFEGLGLHRLIGRCDALNLPSARLMGRLGMRREAHFVHSEIFKGAWGDELVYAVLEDEWRERVSGGRPG